MFDPNTKNLIWRRVSDRHAPSRRNCSEANDGLRDGLATAVTQENSKALRGVLAKTPLMKECAYSLPAAGDCQVYSMSINFIQAGDVPPSAWPRSGLV
jgi:hypothetical protein